MGGGRGGSIYRGLEQNDIEVCVSWIEDTEEKRKEKTETSMGDERESKKKTKARQKKTRKPSNGIIDMGGLQTIVQNQPVV